MPETGFSLRRIRIHLRKWIGLYIAATIALCFLNHLVYTMTRPGFSDDERLKIMLLNTDAQLSAPEYEALGDTLLAQIRRENEGVLTVEFEPLAGVRADDPAGMMLLGTKLIGGYGDIYLCDRAGLEALASRAALLDLGGMQIGGCEGASCVHPETGKEITGGLRMEGSIFGNEIYLCVAANGTDTQGAAAALPHLAECIKE